MIAIIVLLVVTITMSGYTAMQLYEITQNQNLLLQSQKNQSTLALWKSLIASQAKAVGDSNELVIPLGENKANYHTVPSWIYFNTKNPWGTDLIYCPYADNTTGTMATNVSLTPGSSYAVRTVANFATSTNGIQRPYVTASAANPLSSEILAFLISPVPSATSALPSCSSVTYDSTIQKYKVNNGLVEVITKGDVKTYANLANLANLNQGSNSYYNNTIEGDKSTSGDTFNNNITYINGQDIPKVYLKLPAGTHYIENTILNENRDAANETPKVIVIEGDSSSNTIIDTKSSRANLTFNNYKITFKNIQFSSKILLNMKDSDLSTSDVVMYNLFFDNGRWIVKDNTTVSGSSFAGHAITLQDGMIDIRENKVLTVNENTNILYRTAIRSERSEIRVKGVMNITKMNQSTGIDLISSKMYFIYNDQTNTSGVVTFTAADNSYPYDLYIDENSYIFMSSFSKLLLNSQYGINAYGEIISKSGTIYNVNGGVTNIHLRIGSMLNMENLYTNTAIIGNPTLANRASYAIVDEGARYVSGVNGTMYAKTKCFYGDIFAFSQETKGTGNKSVNDFSTVPDLGTKLALSKLNASNWTCNP